MFFGLLLGNFAKMKKLSLLFSIVLNLVCIGLVTYLAWPTLTLYYNQKPALGIDLFLSVNFVTFIQNHLIWPWAGWHYVWYGGMPFGQSYPLFHYYLIQPLLHWFSAVQAVQVYVLASIVLYFIFSYLLFWQVSKSRGLAVILSVATAYSFNLWSALYWAGAVPYTATTFLLPLSLYLVVLAYEAENRKYIYLAALLSGIFILAHPQSFLSYTVPITAILILFFGSKKVKIFAWNKWLTLLVFGLIIYFVGFPQMKGTQVFEIFQTIFGTFSKVGIQGANQSGGVMSAAKETYGTPIERAFDFYRKSNPLFFYSLFIGAVAVFSTTFLAVVLRRKVSHYLKLLVASFLVVLYSLIYLYGFALGITPFAGGWYRIFWPFATVFGFLVAVFWKISTDNLEIILGRLEKKLYRTIIGWVFGSITSAALLFYGISFLQSTYTAFEKETLSYFSESSAFPTALSLNIKKGEWPEKLPKLVPDWLNPNDLNYRLYDMDATVNIWWNSVFKMPLARGYLDASPPGDGGINYSGWQYWQNVTLTKDEVYKVWGVPKNLAKNQAKFLLDWNAIKFVEGAPGLDRNYAAPLSSYVVNDPDLLARSEKVSVFRPGKTSQTPGLPNITDHYQDLTYYEFKDEAVSPIYNASNAPSVLMVGDAVGQDTLMRDFAFLNFNSKKAILVQWNKPIDDLKDEELKNFDLVILYRYKYNSARNAFGKIEKYVSEGGNLFVDSGTEQRESNSSNLANIFPFYESERKSLGKDWDWQIGENQITKSINFKKFGEPMYDSSEWSFSYPTGNLKGGASVLASNHGKPVLLDYKLGKGKIIWSGMNFPGHLQRFKTDDEVKLFKNILFYFKDFSLDQNVKVTFTRPSPEKAIISGSGAKAILFKETAYPGWKLTVNSGGKSKGVPIYQAGPMYYGYMYAFLPQEMQNKPFEAKFEYKGEFSSKFAYLVSILSVLVILDYLFISGRASKVTRKFIKPASRKLGEWWEKEGL